MYMNKFKSELRSLHLLKIICLTVFDNHYRTFELIILSERWLLPLDQSNCNWETKVALDDDLIVKNGTIYVVQ